MSRCGGWILSVLLLVGCSGSHGDAVDDGGSPGPFDGGGFDVGPGDGRRPDGRRFDARRPERDEPVFGPDGGFVPGEGGVIPGDGGAWRDTGVPQPPPGVTVCGGETCAEGEVCCLLTLECFDPADPDACAPPDGGLEPGACTSNADCAEDELCEPGGGMLCGGAVGECAERRRPEDCGESTGVCGCDGRTYATPCEASQAGVSVQWNFPCGQTRYERHTFPCDEEHPSCDPGWTCDFEQERCVEEDPFIACGIDAQCPEGYFCCHVVGGCMPADCPECCFVPPEGTYFPCLENEDCVVLDDRVGDFEEHHYCQGASGCGSPGGCKDRPNECGGELDPVCGCDGVSYANACWPAKEGIAVDHPGECP